MLGSTARYWMLHGLYSGGDAGVYHRGGKILAQSLSASGLSALGDYSLPGSDAIFIVTGLLYAVLPPSLPSAYFFFATLAFAGSVFFYRAFRLAVSDSEPGFYRFIIFFLPSILFWPSSLGKESWVFFGSGIAAYGFARFARRSQLSSLAVAGLGLGVVFPPRPHFAAFLLLAAGMALLFFQRIGSRRELFVTLIVAGVIIVLGAFAMRIGAENLGIRWEEEVWEETEAAFELLQQQTFAGGSSYEPQNPFTLLGAATAPVTILFRPFLWEAHNAQAMVSALESLLWLGLFWIRRHVFLERLRSIRKNPTVALAAAYSVMLILGLTVSGNFGIIARQRVALLPFLWMLFA
jgi:hypothetical protein